MLQFLFRNGQHCKILQEQL